MRLCRELFIRNPAPLTSPPVLLWICPPLRSGEGRNSRVPPGPKQLAGKARNRGSHTPCGVPMGCYPKKSLNSGLSPAVFFISNQNGGTLCLIK